MPSNNYMLSPGLNSGTPFPLPGRNLIVFLEYCRLPAISHSFTLASITRNCGKGSAVSPPESGGKSHPLQKNRAFPVIVQGHIEELGLWGWARVAMPSLPLSLMPETVLAVCHIRPLTLSNPGGRLYPLETQLKSHSETLVSKLLFDLLKTTHWKQSLLYPFRFNFD